MSKPAIFDRIEIMKAIQSECLSDGVSGILFCPQRVGKSYLLEHLCQSANHPSIIFCRIDLDMLQVAFPKGSGISDQSFFLFLLHQLANQLETKIDLERENEEE